MILLDTNIISELLRKTPEPKVVLWLAAHARCGYCLGKGREVAGLCASIVSEHYAARGGRVEKGSHDALSAVR